MGWPAQHVFLEYMYRISALAQRVGNSAFKDMERNALCSEMKTAAREGKAKIRRKSSTGPWKASLCLSLILTLQLGRKHDGSAQSGEFICCQTNRATSKARPSNLLEIKPQPFQQNLTRC